MNADLTIIIPSYNRGKYIRECFDSIFMQETSYSFHLIIPDDHSTDNSIEIIKEYQAKYPNKITLLESNVNQKLFKNVLRAYEITKTPYFCVLDPDDFWIDKNFIQNGLDFLEKNNDFTIYAANAYMLKNGSKNEYTHCSGGNFDFNDYFSGSAIFGLTSSSIYRNLLFKNGVNEKLYSAEKLISFESFRGDSYRTIASLEKGKLFFSKDYVSVYRITDDGLWMGSTTNNNIYTQMRLFADLFLYFDKKYPKFIYFSYLEYLKIKNKFYDYLKELKIENIKKTLDEYTKILDLYEENFEYIEKTLLETKKPKIKFYYYLYKKLLKKLKRKGIV